MATAVCCCTIGNLVVRKCIIKLICGLAVIYPHTVLLSPVLIYLRNASKLQAVATEQQR